MRIVTTRAELAAARAEATPLALVPTMGFLHEGHLSLVRRAKADHGTVAVSVFVNPTQFGPSEDLSTYPRDLARDLDLLADAGVDLVWTPRVEDIYPGGFSTYVDVEGVTDVLEGAERPGHFRGVATVVNILFNAVRPVAAYFGQKDAQQCVVLRKMVRDLAMDVDVVICPTVREADGLAMSSRNAYLDETHRAAATVLIRALRAAESAWAAGETDADALRSRMQTVLAAEPLAQVGYVSIADTDDLREIDAIDPARGALASLAVRVGKPRLIDNLLLTPR
ncbi:pantoate--beta-alanine ligase [Granulicoccus sp. GXG6511]|uniref:pantoate--beta-alanine ligase n=1 Tax=Granulicoccus sp. GXG6511 TaxID=3381351 RepID=UPI003D7E88D2